MNPTKFSTSLPYSLAGYLLIASPQMTDVRFANTVVLVCGHDQNGAMGLIVNRIIEQLTMSDLFDQLEISAYDDYAHLPIHFGGPVEMSRGFILHSTDFMNQTSLKISSDIALTSTLEILSLVAQGRGPQLKKLALGYASWGAGQLETEIQENSWFQVEADQELVFDQDRAHLWFKAFRKLGINPSLLSMEVGHA